MAKRPIESTIMLTKWRGYFMGSFYMYGRRKGKHIQCVFHCSNARGCKKNIGNKGKYAVLSSASGVESYCRYIIRLPYVIMQIFIASHIILRYMGENEAKETVHRKFSYIIWPQLYSHAIKDFYCALSATFIAFFIQLISSKERRGSIALKWLNSTVVSFLFELFYLVLSRIESGE